MPVIFHAEESDFELENKRIIKEWIADIVTGFGCSIGDLNFIYTSNDYLLKVNKQYLNHHYYTDVITFNYNSGTIISGDIFISVDQVRINSEEFDCSFIEELCRVMIHGTLHLLGKDDHTEEEKREMRKEENFALEKLKKISNGKII